jgi:hypothetical protein
MNLKRAIPPSAQSIIVVSGLPRSGTSMVMQMLRAGGIEIVTDGLRAPDADNPRGYFEFDGVKKLVDRRADTAWLTAADGKAVKIISWLLPNLPPALLYRVIFMRRHLAEVLQSQSRMLARQGVRSAGDDVGLGRALDKHEHDVLAWIRQQSNMDLICLEYRHVIACPCEVSNSIASFLGRGLMLSAMTAAVDPALYRSRSCEPGQG